MSSEKYLQNLAQQLSDLSEDELESVFGLEKGLAEKVKKAASTNIRTTKVIDNDLLNKLRKLIVQPFNEDNLKLFKKLTENGLPSTEGTSEESLMKTLCTYLGTKERVEGRWAEALIKKRYKPTEDDVIAMFELMTKRGGNYFESTVIESLGWAFCKLAISSLSETVVDLKMFEKKIGWPKKRSNGDIDTSSCLIERICALHPFFEKAGVDHLDFIFEALNACVENNMSPMSEKFSLSEKLIDLKITSRHGMEADAAECKNRLVMKCLANKPFDDKHVEDGRLFTHFLGKSKDDILLPSMHFVREAEVDLAFFSIFKDLVDQEISEGKEMCDKFGRTRLFHINRKLTGEYLKQNRYGNQSNEEYLEQEEILLRCASLMISYGDDPKSIQEVKLEANMVSKRLRDLVFSALEAKEISSFDTNKNAIQGNVAHASPSRSRRL